MDKLAEAILRYLDQCTKQYGEEFKERLIHINITKDYGSEHWLVEYNVGSYGDTDKVKGANLDKCVHEFMRRKGWTEANKPMVLIEAVEHEDADT